MANPALAESARTDGPRRAIVLDAGRSVTGTAIPNATADADRIADLLENRFGFEIRRGKKIQPQSLSNTIWGSLNSVGRTADASSRIVVYYRGYLRVEDDSAWLTAVDSRGQRDARNSFELAELTKRLGSVPNCPLTTVFLDVVTENSEAELQQSIEAAARSADRGSSSVALFAAGTPEASPTKSDISQSAMSYWLIDALRGSAIRSTTAFNAQVPPVELKRLVNYTTRKLSGEVATAFAATSSLDDGATVTPARPRKLDELITDLAERTASQIRDRGVEMVVIPDLVVTGHDDSQIPGQEYGPLLRYIGTSFKAQLSSHSYGSFVIAETMFIRDILNRHQITPDSIKGPKMDNLVRDLKQETGAEGTLAVLLVSLKHDSRGTGADVALQCLPTSRDAVVLSPVRGNALLNDSEWAMIGFSAVNQEVAADYLQAPRVPGLPVSTVSTKRIDQPKGRPGVIQSALSSTKSKKALSTKSARANSGSTAKKDRRPRATIELVDFGEPEDVRKMVDHIREMQKDSTRENPLLDPTFPWRISVKASGQAVSPEFSKDKRHAYVNIARGGTYSIGIQNQGNKPVFLRLLVDGLNTLPDQPLLEKNDKFEAAVKDAKSKLLPAQYVSLTNARAWFCEGEQNYEVRGFFTKFENGKSGLSTDATLRQFVVTDAQSSEAASQGYVKDVGIITAAFYEPADVPVTMSANSGDSAVLGTRLGKEQTEKVDPYQGKQVPGRLLGVVHLRYGIPRESGKAAKSVVVN